MRSWLPSPLVPLAALLAVNLALAPAAGHIRDGGIVPWNLGKGDWIYIMGNAPSQYGGSLASLMAYEKNQGMSYLIIKAGTGDQLYNGTGGSPQFTTAVVNAGHAAGLKIFGYNRSYATNTAGEVAIANYVFNQGADGFVWDAEAEWESSRIGSQGPALAWAQCGMVRTNWPNKFLAQAPSPIISYHGSFPYKEFGYWCDAVTPQDYWVDIGVTPSYMVTWMDNEWRNWQNGLSGIWLNSIKPLAPDGQGWNTTGAEITEFVNALKNDASPVTSGGYKGVNYWRAELHTTDDWSAIAANNIGGPYTTAPALSNIGANNISDTSATVSWTADQNTDSVVEYGTSVAYGSSVSNAISGAYHSFTLTGLSASTTYHYRVKSRNPSGLQTTSGDFTFMTNPSGVVNDIIIDNPQANFTGSWVTSSSSGDKYGADYRYKSRTNPGFYGDFIPNILTAGNYQVYEWHPAGSNREADAPHIIAYNGGSQTLTVNQIVNGGRWNLLGTFNFAVGTAGHVRITDGFTTGTNVMADAMQFVYVPPIIAPALTAQPQNQTVTAGNAATFPATATGTSPAYQWRRNGSNISVATTSTYTRNNCQSADAGNYSVVVANSAGSVTSSNAVLTVNVPPSIGSQPQSQSVKAGTNVTFSVTASGTAPLSYQWMLDGSNIFAANTNTYTRTNVQTNDAGGYSVLVGNVAGSVTSAVATLTVTVPQPARFQFITRLPDRRARFIITGEPGATYTIQDSSNLTTTTWPALMTVVNTNGTLDLIDDSASNAATRFYRTKQ